MKAGKQGLAAAFALGAFVEWFLLIGLSVCPFLFMFFASIRLGSRVPVPASPFRRAR